MHACCLGNFLSGKSRDEITPQRELGLQRDGRGGSLALKGTLCCEVRGWSSANVDVVLWDWQQCCWEFAIYLPLCFSSFQSIGHLKYEKERKSLRQILVRAQILLFFFSGNHPPLWLHYLCKISCESAVQFIKPYSWQMGSEMCSKMQIFFCFSHLFLIVAAQKSEAVKHGLQLRL